MTVTSRFFLVAFAAALAQEDVLGNAFRELLVEARGLGLPGRTGVAGVINVQSLWQK